MYVFRLNFLRHHPPSPLQPHIIYYYQNDIQKSLYFGSDPPWFIILRHNVPRHILFITKLPGTFGRFSCSFFMFCVFKQLVSFLFRGIDDMTSILIRVKSLVESMVNLVEAHTPSRDKEPGKAGRWSHGCLEWLWVLWSRNQINCISWWKSDLL